MAVVPLHAASRLADLRTELRLYRLLLGSRIRSQMQYRASFATLAVVTGGGAALEFLAIVILVSRFGAVGGWSVGEIAFLYGITSVTFSSADMVASGFDAFPAMIRQGTFDQLLVRPVGTFTQVLAAEFQLRRIGGIVQGIGALVVAFSLTTIDLTPMKLLALAMALSAGVVVVASLFVFGAVICFWTVDSVELMNSLTYGGRQMSSFPLTIYHEALQRFFTFIVPLVFVSYFPAMYVLDKPERHDWPGWVPFASPLVALVVATLAYLAWGFGVRRYRSTGS